MKDLFTYKTGFCLLICTLFAACARDDAPGRNDTADEKIRIEIFTRAESYRLPARAAEDAVGRTPWIVVFTDTGAGFVFAEAAQAFELSAISKIYVDLTVQTAVCKLLILANPQSAFYLKTDASRTPYAYSEANLANALGGLTIEQAADRLCTAALSDPQTAIPYAGATAVLPMHYVLDLPGGIDRTTQIGTSAQPLQLVRATARIVVRCTDSDFMLTGITAVGDAPSEGLLFRLPGGNPPDNDSQAIVEYNAGDGYLTPIAAAASGSTADAPVYLYESKAGTAGSDTYLIIAGQYAGTDYFYKMPLVDSEGRRLDILRNHAYTFTIVRSRGKGFDTVADAKIFGSQIDYNVTVTDLAAYETIANNDCYLGLTNSISIIYTDEESPVYTLASLATDCRLDYPNRTVSLQNQWFLELTGADENGKVEIPVVTASTTDPVYLDIEVTGHNMPLAYPWGGALLRLGDLEKKIEFRRGRAIPADGKTLSIGPNWTWTDDNGNPDGYEAVYLFRYVSGYVVEETAKEWIKLVSGSGVIRNDADNITTDDGIIKIVVLPNETTTGRKGTVFLTAGGDNDVPNPSEKWFRIKVDISQAAGP